MRDPASELERLLAEERAILLSGRLGEIMSVADRKTELLARLAASPANLSDWRRLQQTARRNQDLLDAAAAGLRDARARLIEVRQSSVTLSTYSSDGVRRTVPTVREGVERRV
jgi:flagellar biosynthesis/type III secretory pathway chaperone